MPSVADAQAEIGRAIELLASGGLVAFPTETVWGIAADVQQSTAVEQLRCFKGRDPAQPISLLVSGPEALEPLGCQIGSEAEALIAVFWPGPITLVLPCRANQARFGAGIVNSDGGLAIRCSSHPVASALARAAAAARIGPLTATSCNRHGDPAAETREQARAICSGTGGPLLIEQGDDARGSQASTVVDLCVQPPQVVRAGAVAESAIRESLSHTAPPTEDPCLS